MTPSTARFLTEAAGGEGGASEEGSMSSISLNDPRAVRPDTAAAKSDRAAHPLTNWHSKHHESLTPGQRAADRLRNWMGSWLFIGGFLLFMVVWAAMNAMSLAWDPYPFILLNLFLSMLAGLQGAILLISAKRQDGISAALAQHDYETNIATKQELEELMEMNRLQLALMRELHHRKLTDES